MSKEVPTDAPHARLACIKKWSDFNGYGFNLHAEKGKAGQFIGKVDAGSPAEYAGLRKNDRIVEVNGQNIANQNHGQVVELIRRSGSGDEVSLLVVDKEADEYYQKRNMVVRSDMTAVVDKAVTPMPRPEKGSAEENYTNGEVKVEVSAATVVLTDEDHKDETTVVVTEEVVHRQVVTTEECAPYEREPSPEPVREPTPEPIREPSPEPEHEVNNVQHETVETTETVVTTTETVTTLEINQNEDHKIVEPARTPSPTPEPVIVAAQTTHVESVPTKAPAPQPQANGGDPALKLNMSAKEYREHLRQSSRHSQKNANIGFGKKKGFFDQM